MVVEGGLKKCFSYFNFSEIIMIRQFFFDPQVTGSNPSEAISASVSNMQAPYKRNWMKTNENDSMWKLKKDTEQFF